MKASGERKAMSNIRSLHNFLKFRLRVKMIGMDAVFNCVRLLGNEYLFEINGVSLSIIRLTCIV